MSFSYSLKHDKDKIAIRMSAFPEINFLDLKTGERTSVAYREKMNVKKVLDDF